MASKTKAGAVTVGAGALIEIVPILKELPGISTLSQIAIIIGLVLITLGVRDWPIINQ